MQTNLEVTVGSGDSLDVRHFNVSSGMSRPFTAEVVAVGDSHNIDFEAIVGAPATFVIATGSTAVRRGNEVRSADDRRVFSGVCSDARHLGAEEKGLSTYRLRIVPTFSLLDHRTNNRIFQYKSEVQIALQILSEWGIPVDVRVDLASHKRRKYKVQYEESDMAFVSRMLEEAGVAYFFDTTSKAAGTMIIVEQPERSERRAEPIRFSDAPNLDGGIEYATDLQVERRVAPGRYTVRDHDYRLAATYKLLQTSEAGVGIEKKLEIFDYVEGAFLFTGNDADDGKFADRKGRTRTDETEGKKLAARRLDALRAESFSMWFETNAFDVGVGSVIAISDHQRTEDKPLLVIGEHSSGGFDGNWEHSCEATSALAPYRPPLRTPRPVANGVESAVVVGPAGEEIHCDEFGRVKVHFHWDRDSRMDDDSSCWIHVSQSWGGAGFGGSQLPRIGQEVLVEFLGGDPDRPIIMGRVYTALQTTPYALPANKTQSGLKSNSTGGTGGFNEIMMEDKAGGELLRMRAERDRSTHVGNDCSTTVKNNRSMSIGSNHSTKVGGDQSNVVKGSRTGVVKGSQTVTVTGPSSHTAQSVSITAQNEYVAIAAAKDVSTGSPLIRSVAEDALRLTCGGSRIYMTPSTIAMDAPTILINPGPGMMDYVAFHGGPPARPDKPEPPAFDRPVPPDQIYDPDYKIPPEDMEKWRQDNADKINAWKDYDQKQKQYETDNKAYTQRVNEISNSSRYRPAGYENADLL